MTRGGYGIRLRAGRAKATLGARRLELRRWGRDACSYAAGGAPPVATLLAVSAVFVVISLAVYVAGLVLLAWEGRRDLAILLAAVGGVALSIATLP